MKISRSCFALTGLYYFTPWSVNAGFIIGKDTTLIIDSGGSSQSAQTIFGYAETAQPENNMLLINTEKHLDHIGGNGFFRDRGVPIYGHHRISRTHTELMQSIEEENAALTNSARRNNREAFIPFAETVIANPDHLINGSFEIDLGECPVQVMLTPGHTDTNISVYHREDKVIYCGDCILPGIIPNLEDDTAELKCWIDSLEIIQCLNIETVVPGHGNVITGKDAIQREIDRIRIILEHSEK